MELVQPCFLVAWYYFVYFSLLENFHFYYNGTSHNRFEHYCLGTVLVYFIPLVTHVDKSPISPQVLVTWQDYSWRSTSEIVSRS